MAYIFYYSDNKICFICSIYLSNVCVLNYLTNLCFYKFYHKLDRRIKLFCPENNIINKSKIEWFIFKLPKVLNYFDLLDLRMIERMFDRSEFYFRIGKAQDYCFSEDFYYIDDKRDQETIIVNNFNFIIKNNRLIVNEYKIKKNEEISVKNEDNYEYYINNIKKIIFRNIIGKTCSDYDNTIKNFTNKCIMKRNEKKRIKKNEKNNRKIYVGQKFKKNYR